MKKKMSLVNLSKKESNEVKAGIAKGGCPAAGFERGCPCTDCKIMDCPFRCTHQCVAQA